MNQISADVPARTGLSRRSVLRAGAHAAWAVPAISVATASPAFAATSGVVDTTPYLGFNRFVIRNNRGVNSPTPGDNWTVIIQLGQNNLDGRPGTVPLGTQITLSMAKGNNRLEQAPTVSDLYPDFEAVKVDNDPHALEWSYVFRTIFARRYNKLEFVWSPVPGLSTAASKEVSVVATCVSTLESPPPITATFR